VVFSGRLSLFLVRTYVEEPPDERSTNSTTDVCENTESTLLFQKDPWLIPGCTLHSFIHCVKVLDVH
jgi:hypothetical protein